MASRYDLTLIPIDPHVSFPGPVDHPGTPAARPCLEGAAVTQEGMTIRSHDCPVPASSRHIILKTQERIIRWLNTEPFREALLQAFRSLIPSDLLDTGCDLRDCDRRQGQFGIEPNKPSDDGFVWILSQRLRYDVRIEED